MVNYCWVSLKTNAKNISFAPTNVSRLHLDQADDLAIGPLCSCLIAFWGVIGIGSQPRERNILYPRQVHTEQEGNGEHYGESVDG